MSMDWYKGLSKEELAFVREEDVDSRPELDERYIDSLLLVQVRLIVDDVRLRQQSSPLQLEDATEVALNLWRESFKGYGKTIFTTDSALTNFVSRVEALVMILLSPIQYLAPTLERRTVR